MDALFDLLLLLGAISLSYSALGVLAEIAERSDPLRQWLRRVLVGNIESKPPYLRKKGGQAAVEAGDPVLKT